MLRTACMDWRLMRRGGHGFTRRRFDGTEVSSFSDLGQGSLKRPEASGTEDMKKSLIVVETTGTGYSAYSHDLDGCVATGRTREEVESQMREAIAFHLEGMARNGQPAPEPETYSAYVEIPVR